MLWVEVANRGLAWLEFTTARQELQEFCDASGLDAPAHAALCADLAVLWRSYAAATFGRAMGSPAAMAWLADVRLRAATSGQRRGLKLPPLRAARTHSRLPASLEELVSTAFVELFASSADAAAVSRCHGLVRAGSSPAVFSSEDDRAFATAAELGVFVGQDWMQCAQLVHGPRAGRYCSKACSNAAFTARKGARDPRYFAAKQAQYRDRRKRARGESPRRDFAFFD
jgi:hypothetical protein